MDHIQKCCGVELHNHHGIQVSAVGKVTVTTRKGVGAVMRVCAHYNLVFNMRCECCQLQWPQEYEYILEALNIYMLVVQMIVVPWLRYDMELQKEYVKEVIVLVDMKRIIECEIIGPWIDKISGRLVASGAERLARILTEQEIHLAAVNAKPVETMHVPVAKHIHKSGANFGGQRDVVRSREKAAKAVLSTCLLSVIQGQTTQEKREERKKKKELKKNKEFFEPLMSRNKHFIAIITAGGSMFSQEDWQIGQNLVSTGLFDVEPASGTDADDDEEKEEDEETDEDEGGEDKREWANRMFVNAAHAVEVEDDQKASSNSKSIASIQFIGTKGTITFPLPLKFTSTVQGEGAAPDLITMMELIQYGGNLQTVDLYSFTGGKYIHVHT